jgi:hypothetical protein
MIRMTEVNGPQCCSDGDRLASWKATAGERNCGLLVPSLQIAFGWSVPLPYNGAICRGWLNIFPMKLSTIFVLVCSFLQLSLPARPCLESCHSRGENCHRPALKPPESPNCPHAKPISAEVVTKAGCKCTIDADHFPPREHQFNLDSFRGERSKFSGSDAPSTEITHVQLEGRLHGPLICLASGVRETFLINSSLRI